MKRLVKVLLYAAAFVLFLYANNHLLGTTEYTIESDSLPTAFDGFRIVQVSDLHDATFGEGQQRLVEEIREAEPDVVFLTGDLIDSRRYDLENSLDAVRKLTAFADVYYVLGNHEVAVNEVDEIYMALERLGVHILPNQSLEIERDGERLAIVGIEDPLMGKEVGEMLDVAMAGLDEDIYTILLSHRPEEFEDYVEHGLDVVFTGHAHGGQVRLPLMGGLIAPGQGWLPTYTSGMHVESGTSMLVSRGLGNSLVTQRLFNPPELIAVELKAK